MNHKKKWIAAGAALALLAAALPTALSTGIGRNAAVSLANLFGKGQMEIDELSLSWTGGQEVVGLRITKEGRETLGVDRLTTEASLFGLATGGRTLGKTHLLRPRALIADGASDKKEARTPTSSREPQPFDLPFLGEIQIEEGSLRIEREGHEPVELRNLNATLKADQLEGPLTAKFTGTTEQNGVAGTLSVDGFVDGFDSRGRLEFQIGPNGLPHLNDRARLGLDLDVIKLPLAAVSGPLAEALGATIDIQLQNSLDKSGLTLDGTVRSPQLRAQLSGRTADGHFELTSPGEATLQLAPHYLSKLSRGMTFSRPINAQITLQQMRFPLNLNDMSFDLTALELLAALSLDDVSITDRRTGTVEFLNTQSRIESKPQQSTINVSGGADLYHNQQAGKLQIAASLDHFFDETSPFTTNFTLRGSSLPVGLIDHISGYNGLLTDLIGRSVELNLAGQSSDGASNLLLSLTSPTATIEKLQIVMGERLSIKSATPLQLNLPPNFVERFLPPGDGIRVQQGTPLTLTINKLDFSAGELIPEDSHIDATLEMGSFDASGMEGVGAIRAHDGRITLKGSLDRAELKQRLTVDLLDSTSTIGATFGRRMEIRGEGTLFVKPDFRMDLLHLLTEVKGEHTHLTVRGKLLDREDLTISSADFSHTLTPAGFRAIVVPSPDGTQLLQPMDLTIKLDPMRIQLDELDPYKLHLRGRSTVDRFVVGKSGIETGALYEGKFDWNLDFPNGVLSTQIAATTRSSGQKGSLSGQTTLTNWRKEGKTDFDKARLDSTLAFTKLPVPFLEALSGYPELDAIIGDTLELSLNMQIANLTDPVGHMDLYAEGQDFEAKADLLVDKGMSLKDNKPASVKWRITPKRFDAMRAIAGSKHPLRLKQTANVLLSVDTLSIPWSGLLSNQAAQLDIVVGIDKLVLEDLRHKQTTIFNDFKAHVKGSDLTDLLDFSLSGGGSIGGSSPMSLSLVGQLGQVLTPQGEINWEGMSKKVDAKAENIPASLAADSFGLGRDLQEQMAALFGDRLDFTAHADVRQGSGPVVANITAEHSKFDFNGRISNHILTLSKPMTGEIEVTPELSRTVLKNINPLLVTAVKGEQPVRLTVETHGVRIPTQSWDVSQLSIGKATVEVGKVTLTNGGPLALIVGILQSGRLSGRDTMQSWFTPQYITIQNGQLTAERMDMLIADNFHLATWGNIDLPGDQIKMTLGIPAHTLAQNFGLKGMNPSHMMQVPIKGTLTNPKINVGKAVARIAAMRAGQSSGESGQILGGIFGMIGGGGAISDGPAPPPTTNPLPWPTPEGAEQVLPVEVPKDEPVEKKSRPKIPGLPDIFDIFK